MTFTKRHVYHSRARDERQAIRSMRAAADAIYTCGQDDAGGSLPCKFFHGGYLEGRLKPGQLLILMARRRSISCGPRAWR